MQTLRPSALLFISLAAIVWWGCGGPAVEQVVEVEGAEMVLEGPLFEGPNSGQITWSLNLPAVMGDDFNPDLKVVDARLVRAEVRAGDAMGFDQVRSFVLSFASDNEDVAMQEAAFVNPLPPDLNKVALEAAPNAELGPHLAEGQVYVVLDVDLAEDFWEGSRLFLLDFDLSLTLQ